MTSGRERITAGLVPCAIAALTLSHPGLVSRSSTFLAVSLAAAVGVVIAGRLVATTKVDVGKPVLVAVLSLALASLVAFVRTPTTAGLVVWVAPLLYMLGGSLMAARERLVTIFSAAIVTAAAVAGAYGLLQFAGLDALPSATRFQDRVVSTFENPNYFASFMACAFPIGLASFVSEWRTKQQLWLGAAVCVIYTGLLIAGSRGAWWGAAAGVAIVVLAYVRQCQRGLLIPRIMSLVALGILLLCITLALRHQPLMAGPDGPIALAGRLAAVGNIVGEGLKADPTMSHRYLIWKVTLRLIADRPIIGHGLGRFQEQFVEERTSLQFAGLFPRAGWSADYDPVYVHNEYLHIWVERGFVAVAALLGLLGAVLIPAGSALWSTQHKAMAIAGFWAFAAVVLVHSLVSYPLQLPLSGMLFWLVIGILGNRHFLRHSGTSEGK